jgi:hypothetical protein
MVARYDVVDFDVVDARTRRPVPDVPLKSLDGFGFTLNGDLHTAVRQIPHPSVQPFASGHCFSEEPEPDTLNAAADEVPSPNTHDEARDYTAFTHAQGPRVTTTKCVEGIRRRHSTRPEVAHIPSRSYTTRTGRPSATNSSNAGLSMVQ